MSARRVRRPPAKTEQAWLATYGDMVTLLMAFFVMMFAISSIEQEKFDAFVAGLEQFGNTSGDPVGDPAAVVEPPVPFPEPELGEGDQQLPPALEALGQQILDAVAAAGHPGAVEITHDERGLGVTIETDSVLFDVGSARITTTGSEIVAAVAPPLATVPNEVLLEGHADNTPLNRNGYTNWNLSTDRAVAVVNELVQRHGLGPDRLTASGYGEFRPRDAGATAEAKARNRRVELIVVNDEPRP